MKEFNCILQPVVTEKATDLSTKGKYVFYVAKDSTKVDVKKAVEKIYGVKVDTVRTVIVRPKERMLAKRRTLTKRSKGKKAIVTLKKGEKTIDIHKLKVKA
jgi:large subunit ribosomal protein L23